MSEINNTEITNDYINYRRVFFIGIGGVSMSSIAMIMKKNGYDVGGSDWNRSACTDELSANGIDVKIGEDASYVNGYDLVVYTAAVKDENPELAHARKIGIPCASRGEYLGWLMTAYSRRIGVAGTHGKSTTTAMISKIMLDVCCNPTILCGAEIHEIDGMYRIGGKENFVFEACEYKDSFLSFAPNISVITNIELDHTDYFKSIEQLRDSFTKYMNYADTAVLNFDNANVRLISKSFTGKRIVSFAFDSSDAEFHAENIRFTDGMGEFTFTNKNDISLNVKLAVPGLHNVYNAMAALCVAYVCGVNLENSAKALEDFIGVSRRFEFKGKLNGADVYDDYAHHPTEIAATLNAAKGLGYKKIYCVFQPHTYTRTKELFADFVESLKLADVAILADIFAAREAFDETISSKMVSDKIPNSLYLDSFVKIADYLRANAGAGDLILTVGAGDVNKVANLILK